MIGSRRYLALVGKCCLLFVLAALFGGCETSSSGPTRYPVSGTVKHKGQLVPKGFITLEPDTVGGNSGPGGGAEIVDGRYDTKTAAGVVGGSYKVRIVGTDGQPATVSGETLPEGRPLFAPYETIVDFPKEATVKDFEVP